MRPFQEMKPDPKNFVMRAHRVRVLDGAGSGRSPDNQLGVSSVSISHWWDVGAAVKMGFGLPATPIRPWS